MRNTFTLISSQKHNFIFGMFIVFSLKYLQMGIGDNNWYSRHYLTKRIDIIKSVVKTNLVFIKFLYINVMFMQYPF